MLTRINVIDQMSNPSNNGVEAIWKILFGTKVGEILYDIAGN